MDVLTICNNDVNDLSLIVLKDYDYHPVRSLSKALEEFGILHINGDTLHEGLEASVAGQAEIEDYTFQVSYVEAGDVLLFKYHPDREEH